MCQGRDPRFFQLKLWICTLRNWVTVKPKSLLRTVIKRIQQWCETRNCIWLAKLDTAKLDAEALMICYFVNLEIKKSKVTIIIIFLVVLCGGASSVLTQSNLIKACCCQCATAVAARHAIPRRTVELHTHDKDEVAIIAATPPHNGAQKSSQIIR